MSGGNAPEFSVSTPGMKVAIVASQWHETIMSALIAGATATCESAGATTELVRVPGAFELPLGVQRVARLAKVEAIVALGVVIRGGTPHFEYVCNAATEGLLRVSLDEGIPVGFGLLTVDNEQQALDRCGLPDSPENKGEEAAQAALVMALQSQLRDQSVGFR